MPLTDAERIELNELRALRTLMELNDADHQNPNVLLIEGELTRHSGEFSATGVQTKAGHIYLAQVLEDLQAYSNKFLAFAWHIASEPMSFHQLEEQLVKTAMGTAKIDFYHSYSDLTGYLWTNEKVEVAGHDILAEIYQTISNMPRPVYIAMRVEQEA